MLALIVLGIGALFSLIFHTGTKEHKPAAAGEGPLRTPSPSEETLPLLVFQWKHWLKEPSFYQVTPTSVLGTFIMMWKVSLSRPQKRFYLLLLSQGIKLWNIHYDVEGFPFCISDIGDPLTFLLQRHVSYTQKLTDISEKEEMGFLKQLFSK